MCWVVAVITYRNNFFFPRGKPGRLTPSLAPFAMTFATLLTALCAVLTDALDAIVFGLRRANWCSKVVHNCEQSSRCSRLKNFSIGTEVHGPFLAEWTGAEPACGRARF